MASPNPIGLIAGAGELPFHFIRQAKSRGCPVITAAIRGSAPASIEKLSDGTSWISVGQLGALLSFFHRAGVKRAVMHGKVQHSQLFKNLRVDWKGLTVWGRLKDRSGKGLLTAVAGELKGAGITLLDGRTFMQDILIRKGWLTRVHADKSTSQAITYGLKQARGLARLGIGQTLVVKGQAIVAVEAMEGTDETIRRAGQWAGKGAVAVKVAGPGQDWRFDIPTLGPQTIQSLVRARARGIVVEAGKTFLLGGEKTLAVAQKSGIFILAV